MKAVNLIPVEARKSRGGASSSSQLKVPTFALLGALAAALVLVTLYVLSSNTVAQRTAQLSTLQAQVSQAQAEASRLGSYEKFAQIARTRLQTVSGIASTRFDWHTALSDLSKVMPSDTSLQSLAGTVAPGAGNGGGSAGGAGSAGGLRGDIAVPAFALVGCTKSHRDVARLMSRLRLIRGVTRVTLGDAAESDATQAASSSVTQGSSGGAQGCGPNSPTFDLVVFFTSLPGAGPNGATSVPTTTSTRGGAR
jgi:Tfp pilus assembly protein PilN